MLAALLPLLARGFEHFTRDSILSKHTSASTCITSLMKMKLLLLRGRRALSDLTPCILESHVSLLCIARGVFMLSLPCVLNLL